MIARIRIRDKGRSRFLCELDIMAFSEEQIRGRMEDRGFSDDAFFICGFSDWESDRQMLLSDAYLLKKCITDLYDGDDYLVRYLLQTHIPVTAIVTHYYTFVSKDEKEAMVAVLEHMEIASVIALFQESQWSDVLQSYLDSGYLLNTPKGFYIDKTY